MSVTRDELRKAAQSISPRQFDRIALEYLEISQVRLDQLHRDYDDKGCIEYMYQCLVEWSEENHYDRKELHRCLYRAAREDGLLSIVHINFLTEKPKLCIRILRQIQSCTKICKDKCLTCYCLGFSIITIIPLILITSVSVQYDLSINKHEDLISPIDIEYNSGPLFRLNIAIIILLVLLWITSFFSRHKKFTQVILALFYGCVYILWLAASCASVHYFKNVSLSMEDISENLFQSMKGYPKDKDIKVSWDKMQNLFQCCGTNNNTEWLTIIVSIPFSCFGEKTHASLNSPSLYENGCLPQFKSYAVKEIKGKCTEGVIFSVINLVCIIIPIVITLAFCLLSPVLYCRNRRYMKGNSTVWFPDGFEQNQAYHPEYGTEREANIYDGFGQNQTYSAVYDTEREANIYMITNGTDLKTGEQQTLPKELLFYPNITEIPRTKVKQAVPGVPVMTSDDMENPNTVLTQQNQPIEPVEVETSFYPVSVGSPNH